MKKLSLLQLSTLILIVILVLIYILKPKEVENLEFKSLNILDLLGADIEKVLIF